MMDAIFDLCVRILVFLTERTGMTYQEINIWIFVFLWPLVTLLLVAVILVQRRRIRALSSARMESQNK